MAKARKTISTLLAAVVLATQCVFAYAGEASYWTERRRNAEARRGDPMVLASLPAALPSAVLPQAAPPVPSFLPAGFVQAHKDLLAALPGSLGSIRQVSLGKPGGPLVVHIQDVHQNADAQKNIAGAVKSLTGSGAASLVALEGAWDALDLAPFQKFADRAAVAMAAEYLLQENQISGPVHAGLTGGGRFAGIDDESHHGANVAAYRASSGQIPAAKAALEKLSLRLAEEKARSFSPELKNLDGLVGRYHQGQAGLGDYAAGLARAGVRPSRNVETFLAALHWEKTLDFAAVEKDRAALIEKLTSRLSPQALRDLAAKSVAYRTGEMSYGDFYRELERLCARTGLALAALPAMRDYIRYVLLSETIDAEALLAELAALEKAAFARLAKTERQKSLAAESRALHLAGKLLDFSLTPPEWREYRQNPAALPLAAFEDFYREAEARDLAMARNVLALAQKETKPIILVTGGYHAEGMAKELTRGGATVVRFVPRIGKIDTAQGAAYLTVFNQEKTPLEKLVAGEKLFLAKAPIADSTRHYLAPFLVAAAALGANPGSSDPAAHYAALGGLGALSAIRTVNGKIEARITGRSGAVDLAAQFQDGRLVSVTQTAGASRAGPFEAIKAIPAMVKKKAASLVQAMKAINQAMRQPNLKGSLFDSQAVERWGKNSPEYRFYTRVLVNWEGVFQFPGLNLVFYGIFYRMGLVAKVPYAGLATVLGSLAFLAAACSILPAVVGVGIWASASAYIFSGAHKDRSGPERAALFVLGFVLVFAVFAPALLCGWDLFDSKGFMLGYAANFLVHSFYNRRALKAGSKPASLFLPAQHALAKTLQDWLAIVDRQIQEKNLVSYKIVERARESRAVRISFAARSYPLARGTRLTFVQGGVTKTLFVKEAVAKGGTQAVLESQDMDTVSSLPPSGTLDALRDPLLPLLHTVLTLNLSRAGPPNDTYRYLLGLEEMGEMAWGLRVPSEARRISIDGKADQIEELLDHRAVYLKEGRTPPTLLLAKILRRLIVEEKKVVLVAGYERDLGDLRELLAAASVEGVPYICVGDLPKGLTPAEEKNWLAYRMRYGLPSEVQGGMLIASAVGGIGLDLSFNKLLSTLSSAEPKIFDEIIYVGAHRYITAYALIPPRFAKDGARLIFTGLETDQRINFARRRSGAEDGAPDPFQDFSDAQLHGYQENALAFVIKNTAVEPYRVIEDPSLRLGASTDAPDAQDPGKARLEEFERHWALGRVNSLLALQELESLLGKITAHSLGDPLLFNLLRQYIASDEAAHRVGVERSIAVDVLANEFSETETEPYYAELLTEMDNLKAYADRLRDVLAWKLRTKGNLPVLQILEQKLKPILPEPLYLDLTTHLPQDFWGAPKPDGGAASIADENVKIVLGTGGLYKTYTVVGVIWEILYQVPILNFLAQWRLSERGIARRVPHALSATLFGALCLVAGLAGPAPLIVGTTLWALSSAYVFSGAHKGKNWAQRKLLFALGFVLAGALAAPAVIFALAGPFALPFFPVDSFADALAAGAVLNWISHGLFNAGALYFGYTPGSLKGGGKNPIAAQTEGVRRETEALNRIGAAWMVLLETFIPLKDGKFDAVEERKFRAAYEWLKKLTASAFPEVPLPEGLPLNLTMLQELKAILNGLVFIPRHHLLTLSPQAPNVLVRIDPESWEERRYLGVPLWRAELIGGPGTKMDAAVSYPYAFINPAVIGQRAFARYNQALRDEGSGVFETQLARMAGSTVAFADYLSAQWYFIGEWQTAYLKNEIFARLVAPGAPASALETLVRRVSPLRTMAGILKQRGVSEEHINIDVGAALTVPKALRATLWEFLRRGKPETALFLYMTMVDDRMSVAKKSGNAIFVDLFDPALTHIELPQNVNDRPRTEAEVRRLIARLDDVLGQNSLTFAERHEKIFGVLPGPETLELELPPAPAPVMPAAPPKPEVLEPGLPPAPVPPTPAAPPAADPGPLLQSVEAIREDAYPFSAIDRLTAFLDRANPGAFAPAAALSGALGDVVRRRDLLFQRAAHAMLAQARAGRPTTSHEVEVLRGLARTPAEKTLVARLKSARAPPVKKPARQPVETPAAAAAPAAAAPVAIHMVKRSHRWIRRDLLLVKGALNPSIQKAFGLFFARRAGGDEGKHAVAGLPHIRMLPVGGAGGRAQVYFRLLENGKTSVVIIAAGQMEALTAKYGLPKHDLFEELKRANDQDAAELLANSTPVGQSAPPGRLVGFAVVFLVGALAAYGLLSGWAEPVLAVLNLGRDPGLLLAGFAGLAFFRKQRVEPDIIPAAGPMNVETILGGVRPAAEHPVSRRAVVALLALSPAPLAWAAEKAAEETPAPRDLEVEVRSAVRDLVKIHGPLPNQAVTETFLRRLAGPVPPGLLTDFMERAGVLGPVVSGDQAALDSMEEIAVEIGHREVSGLDAAAHHGFVSQRLGGVLTARRGDGTFQSAVFAELRGYMAAYAFFQRFGWTGEAADSRFGRVYNALPKTEAQRVARQILDAARPGGARAKWRDLAAAVDVLAGEAPPQPVPWINPGQRTNVVFVEAAAFAGPQGRGRRAALDRLLAKNQNVLLVTDDAAFAGRPRTLVRPEVFRPLTLQGKATGLSEVLIAGLASELEPLSAGGLGIFHTATLQVSADGVEDPALREAVRRAGVLGQLFETLGIPAALPWQRLFDALTAVSRAA